ncbi:hypothetical protein [Prosthecobacter sp.]|uniref:hypothetical protein n=1 Tax=Prosthecobacter sp. TaxID=1965333 RepID=UPI002ABA33B9|nr:hypothetical protein [Prosthecobacter sp.]MDZ4405000.1 hypothetical protein [Prosthecobacter sp.]
MLINCAHHAPLPLESVVRQRALAALMQSPASPLLTAVHEFMFEPGFHLMTAEMPPGRDLRDILRVQQSLTVEQMEQVLIMLRDALKAAVEQSWPRFTLDATQIVVDAESNTSALLIPDMPLFGMSATMPVDAMQTMAFNPTAFASTEENSVPESTREYVTPLATLCSEMLGASAGGGGQNERFRAIPSLTIYQNTLLRSALAGTQRHSFESLDEFVGQFLSGGEGGRTTIPPRHTASPSRVGARTAHTAVPATSGSTPAASITTRTPADVDTALLQAPPAGYEINRELRTRDGWRLCVARHPSMGDVLLTTLDVSAEVGEAMRRLSGLMQTLQQSTRLELLRPLDVQRSQRILHVARPLPPGRSLLDALRERRSFSRPTVARLLVAILASYEALWSLVERQFVATSLDQFWLPAGKGEADDNGLLLDASQLILESVGTRAQLATRPVTHFARLALLLLGQDSGALSGEGPVRFSPVPELSSEINGMLRRAVSPDQSGDLTLARLHAQLTAALAGHTAVAHASRHVLKVPEDLQSVPVQANLRLRLSPVDNAQPTIALVADDSLWLGRVGTHSDYVAQFRPRNPVNDSRTRLISRAQATAFMQNGQIFLRDIGTTNPSFTAGHHIGSPEIADLPMTLVLAGEYSVEIRLLKSAYATPGPAVIGWPSSKSRSLRRGGCVLYSLDRGTLPCEVAWIFTDASLAIDTTGRLAFDDTDAQNSAARFHHHAGGFWIEATAASVMDLNGRHLQPGEVAPLGQGDTLRLQGQLFQIQPYSLESTQEG